MLSKLSSLHQLFLLVFIIIILTASFFYFSYGVNTSLYFTVIMLITLYITRGVWLVHKTSKNTIRITSLTVAVATVGTFSLWQDFAAHFISSYLEIEGLKPYKVDAVFPYSILIFILLVIFIVNYYTRDDSGMGEHPVPLKEDIPARNYTERLISVCGSIREGLRSIDQRSNWSNQYFVSLDAEVEIYTENGRQRKIFDLLNAIKKSNDRLFLVLGDPGSGKSVALRQLCSDLLEESSKTGKIPVYVNLKEWQSPYRWSLENKPSLEDLKNFILSYLKNTDIVSSKFFNEYFDRLYETGRLYFILDSFDEIPAILNEEENSELMDYVSELFYKFLQGARSESSQGVLASRNFRKPTKLFRSKTTLEIVPLSEKKVEKFFKLRVENYKEIIKLILKERQDLIIVLKNPFLASLLVDYLDKNENSLPEDQFSMYSSFIKNTLYDCRSRLSSYGVSEKEVLDYSMEIAKMMFESNSLEVNIEEMVATIKDEKFTKVADVLEFAKIARLSNTKLFSFSHRRFAEFFYAFSMKKDSLYLEAIPSDSQSRDALVLFCQIVEEDVALEIARYCFNIIRNDTDISNTRTIHTLRFLNDAYIGRKNCIEEFQEELYHIIDKQIVKDNSMIRVKTSLEFVGLLTEKRIDEIVTKAISLGNYWTNDSAIKSCRHLGYISVNLENQLIDYVSSISIMELVDSKFYDLNFSLNLSDAFKKVRKILFVRLYDIFPTCILLFFPMLFVVLILLMGVLSSAGFSNKEGLNFISKYYIMIYIINTLLTLLFIYWSNSFSLIAIYSKNRYEKIKELFYFMALSIFMLIVMYFVFFYLPEKVPFIKYLIRIVFDKVNYIIIFIGSIMILGVGVGIILRLYELFKDVYTYYTMSISSKMDREKIYSLFHKFNNSLFRKAFISKVENEVHTAYGEWPSKQFLNMTSDRDKIRLAILDEKWLGYKK